MLPIKAYIGKGKINSGNKVTSSEACTWNHMTLLVAHLVLDSHAFLTELTWQCL